MVPLALLRLTAAAAAVLAPLAAHAHHADGPVDAAHGWNLAPWLLVLLGISAALYAIGASRLWRRAGVGRGITPWEAARYAAGWLVLVLALVSPLDALGERSFSLHMVQHEMLMVLAAPLLAGSRSLEAFTWALSPAWRRGFSALAHHRVWTRLWGWVTEPVGAWALHALALWVWHVPRFFDAALRDGNVHIAQHASFFLSALLFWWSVIARRSRQAEGVAVASLFTTMMHTSVLGALLTFAPSVWYRAYTVPFAGLSPIEDQQLGGLIMWVPAGMAYIVVGLAIVASWLRDAPRGVRLR